MKRQRAEKIADEFLEWQFSLPYIRYECQKKQKAKLVECIMGKRSDLVKDFLESYDLIAPIYIGGAVILGLGLLWVILKFTLFVMELI